MRVLFRPEARDDVQRARDWYERQAVGLGGEFVRALEAAVAIAQRSPEAFPKVVDEFRRVLLRRFPYSLVYCKATLSSYSPAFISGATRARSVTV